MVPRSQAAGGVAALAFVFAVTAAWWALALWPQDEGSAEWLVRVRAVCFNAAANGLPDASGWLLLIGQPVGMLAVAMVVWGDAIRAGIAALRGFRAGRLALLAALSAIGLGLGAAGARVLADPWAEAFAVAGDELPPDTYPRLDRPLPEIGLLDQHGQRFDAAQLRGRPALVTFAFGHCETVCPAIVSQTLRVRERAEQRARSGEIPTSRVPRIVVVTLDPWRDTPSRLPHIAGSWGLPEDGFVLSGDVEVVEGVLDAWNVARHRDPLTGELTHAPLVYVVDASGRIAYGSSGGVLMLSELLERS